MLYLISYDLYSPGKNYPELIRAIRSYGSWAKVGRSCWMIRSETTAVQIRDNLSQYIDPNDILLVCEVAFWAVRNFDPDVIHWLNG